MILLRIIFLGIVAITMVYYGAGNTDGFTVQVRILHSVISGLGAARFHILSIPCWSLGSVYHTRTSIV